MLVRLGVCEWRQGPEIVLVAVAGDEGVDRGAGDEEIRGQREVRTVASIAPTGCTRIDDSVMRDGTSCTASSVKWRWCGVAGGMA